MSTFLTEEQQVERVKALWAKYGNMVLNTAIAITIAVAGWQFWQSRQLSINDKASILYKELLLSTLVNEESGIEAYGKQLSENFSGTIYADFAELHMARLDVDKSRYDAAIKRFEKVRQQTKSKALQQIVRIRQARVITAQKHYEKALKLLETVDDSSFKALTAQARGDVYLAQGKPQQAREQYKLAINALPEADHFGNLLEMKLNHIPSNDKHVVQSNTKEVHS